MSSNSVQYWQNQLFSSSIIYFIPLCLIALIPSIYLSIKEEVTGILIADIITVSTILGVAFIPSLSIFARKVLYNASLYFISVVLFYYLGSDGPGMLYLLAVTMFVILTMDRFYGYLVCALNLAVCLAFALMIYYELVGTSIYTQYRLDVWITVSSNLIFLSGTAVLLIPHLYQILQNSFLEQDQLREKLRESFRKIKHSEQKFKALVQDGSDLIAVLDEKGVYKYIAPTAESLLSIKTDEILGKNALEFIHPEDHSQILESLAQLAEVDQLEVGPFRYLNKKGNWLWIKTTITNMLGNPAIEGFVANSQNITEQVAYQHQLEESLREKETLLAEIHHRVKNNLAVITSMMELQAMNSQEVELQELLRLAQQRIQTIATIHELLYGSDSLSYINFGENISQLVRNIQSMYSSKEHIAISVDTEDIPLNINQAIPCALMINEVLTNAYKHAFPKGEEGCIKVKLYEEKSGRVHVEIYDNGIGLPNDILEHSSSSIGMTLIHLLREQLEGELHFSNHNGTLFQFSFMKADVKCAANRLD